MAYVTTRDWFAWHQHYDEPGSVLAGRLLAVQDQIRVTGDAALTDSYAGLVPACPGVRGCSAT
jgi:hypothetical protein